MSLSHRFYRATRPLFIASMAGSVLSMSAMTVQAQQPLTPLPITPVLLPAPSSPGTYSAQQIPTVQTESQKYQLVQHEPSLIDRVRGSFRSVSKTPPVDPGMTYPKAPRTTPPMVPAAVPAPAAQPALLQPPVAANPIKDLVPPAPSGSVNTPPVSIPAQTTRPGTMSASLIPPEPEGSSGPSVRNVSELKQFMQPTTRVAEVPPAPTEGTTPAALPKLTVEAPVVETAKTPAPGEPTENATATPAPPPAVPGIPATMQNEPVASKPADPFADLFPEDAKKPASVPAPAPKVEELQSPYTGLTLDSEPKPKETAELLPPPPLGNAGMELPRLDQIPASAPEVPELPAVPKMEEPVKTAEKSTEFDLNLPSEPPKLAPLPTTDIKIQPAPTTVKKNQDAEQKSKFEQIAARKGQTGLKGFCPVVLRDERELVDSSPEFTAVYNNREYQFSSEEAKQKFLADPVKYAPAHGCCDVIHLALIGEKLEGSLDYAVWYKGRLYLFSSVETMETFVAAPSSHATNE